MLTSRQWLSYWKKCLLDSMKTEIDPSGYTDAIEIESFHIRTDTLACLPQANRLIDAQEKRLNSKQHTKDKQDERWEHLEKITVWIAPIQLNPLPRRQSFVGSTKSIYPFWYPAVLDRKGTLSVPGEIVPFVPRVYLTPVMNEQIEYTLGSTEEMDRACATGEIRFKSYEEYINYISDFFEKISGTGLYAYEADGFVTAYTAHILVPDSVCGAAVNLVGLYENLLNRELLPPLLQEFIQPAATVARPPVEAEEWLPVNELHTGQMKASFPLSYSQRKSLYTLLANPRERVFAINGPPGTGKTTLLQSLVANELTQSVQEEGMPRVILACSANNQAVTNIIDSFTKADENGERVRWLPGIEGYALYLPSGSKSKQELGNINYMKPSGEGLFAELETREYLEKARREYLQKGTACFGQPHFSVKELVRRLRDKILASRQTLQTAQKIWTAYTACLNEFEEVFSRCGESFVKKAYDPDGLLSVSVLEHISSRLEDLTEKLLEYFRKESFFRKAGCLMGFGAAVRNRRNELKIIFRRSSIDSLSGPGILPEGSAGKGAVLEMTDRLISICRRTGQAVTEWRNWQRENNIMQNPSTKPEQFYGTLDTTLRYRNFTDAVRYWEGRWLEEMETFFSLPSADQRSRGKAACRARWHRRAMLTPCFVSTFYMAPRFFDYAIYAGKDDSGRSVFENPPLCDFIDWLIVDEAGQVPPEVGAGVFALAKRALVVGDMKQIEPVWNILPKVDMGNLKSEGLIKDYETVAEKRSCPDSFLASSGSIMQMAQHACAFAEPDCGERGTLLVEHRRCYDQIIQYCNELAYHGLLRPMRGPAGPENLFPPLCCYHVEGISAVRNKDRFNEKECEAICRWLGRNKEKIEAKYADGADFRSLEDIVGIITPFVGQKNRLRQWLRNAGLDVNRMKIGTVHALQGAERPIVLFSAVYGPSDVKTMFFDAGNKPNMLNVAVSRAKDSFIVFANAKIFDPRAQTPSGLLAKYLILETDSSK